MNFAHHKLLLTQSDSNAFEVNADTQRIPSGAQSDIVIHLFVREDRKDALEKTLQSRKLQFKVFTLEDAFRRWKQEAPK